MTDQLDLLSIILPVYNAELYLAECIQSIISQTYNNWELIIINDGSTDSSLSIIEKFASAEPRIVVINLAVNSGLVFCLNKGISSAKGPIIVRMDADDVMYPNRLAIQYDYLKTHEDVGVVASDIDVIDADGKNIASWKYPTSHEEIIDVIKIKCPFAHPTVMFRKNLIAGGEQAYRTKYFCEDYDLWIRWNKKTRFYSFDFPLLKYRIHDGQITQKKIRKISSDTFKLLVSSIFKGNLPISAGFYLYKPLFYILSPDWLIKLKFDRRKGL